MKFISTRLGSEKISFEKAVLQGLAPDGGLYIPEFLPQFDDKDILRMRDMSYEEVFFEVTKHFISNDIDSATYKKIIAKSYQNFTHKAIAPLKQLDTNHFLLELFHGPTFAFKDFALQFMGNILDYFLERNKQKIAIIGATSGDTGSAAIYGCMQCKNAQIFILHPHNLISEFQRKQMTTVDAQNVFNIAIDGNFDDCQSMVKQMFAEESSGNSFLENRKIVAANSINFARILAQIVYYFYVGSRLGCSGKRSLSFSVPTGNFGDIYAGFLAKSMGLNINKLIIATNANDILHRFVANNDYSKSELVNTISPSMNIQISNNFERLLFDSYKKIKQEGEVRKLMEEFKENGVIHVQSEVLKLIREDFFSCSVDDVTTKKTVGEIFDETGEIIDPHSAIGVYAAKEFMKSDSYKNEVVVTLATAHPIKFEESLEGVKIPKPRTPKSAKDLYDRKEKLEVIENDIAKVKEFIAKNA